MKKIILLTVGVLFSIVSLSQSVQIDEVKGLRFSGVQPIMSNNGESVAGYYTYYLADKGAKGMRTLEFCIIDKGVTKVSKAQIELHKWATLNNTVFNGKNFLISYDDRKNKQIVFTTLDLDGNIVATENIKADKKRTAYSVVYPGSNGNGFYVVRPALVKNRVRGHYLEKIDNNLQKQWSIEDIADKGYIGIATLVNNENRVVVWREHGKGINKLKPQVICYDANTGETVFTRDGYDGESTILYNQIRLDDNNNILIGGAYVDGERYKSVNNTGVYLLKLNADGEESFYTKIVTKEEIQPVLKKVSKGIAVGSKDKIWLEDVIIDGEEIVLISEMFRKNFNPKPQAFQGPRDLITGKWIGDMSYRNEQGKAPKVTFEIMDYILFKFDSEGSLSEIQPIAKDGYNKLTVYTPYVNLYGMSMAAVVERLGWFDYGFTTTNSAGEKIMVCSNNAEARKPQVFTYQLKGEFAQSQIDLKQEAKINLDDGRVSYFNPMRNEGSNIAVAYYQRKLKRITVNIESVE
jgi:hypothetical protein